MNHVAALAPNEIGPRRVDCNLFALLFCYSHGYCDAMGEIIDVPRVTLLPYTAPSPCFLCRELQESVDRRNFPDLSQHDVRQRASGILEICGCLLSALLHTISACWIRGRSKSTVAWSSRSDRRRLRAQLPRHACSVPARPARCPWNTEHSGPISAVSYFYRAAWNADTV